MRLLCEFWDLMALGAVGCVFMRPLLLQSAFEDLLEPVLRGSAGADHGSRRDRRSHSTDVAHNSPPNGLYGNRRNYVLVERLRRRCSMCMCREKIGRQSYL